MAKDKNKSPGMLRIPIVLKLAISITILIVIGMTTLGFIILENQKKIMSEQVIGLGETIANQLANSSKDMLLSEDNLGLQTLVNNLIDENKILGASIYKSDKKIVVTSGYSSHHEKINGLQQVEHAFSFDTYRQQPGQRTDALITFVSPIVFNNLLAGHVEVIFSKRSMQQSMDASKRVIISVTVLMTIIAIIFAFMLSKHLSKPIYELVDASKEIGEGNFQHRLYDRRNDEIGDLFIAFNEMSEGLQEKAQVESAFSRYVSTDVAKNILDNLDNIELGGEHVQGTVIFADMVGFTAMSENMQPKEITRLLNEYFSYISKAAETYNGYIDKFIGDCAMIVFGVPEHDDKQCLHGILCGILIQKLVYRLNKARREKFQHEINFKIGMNTGDMVAGNLGTQERMEYTVIGDAVNLASRLAAVARGNQIVISEAVYKVAGGDKNVLAHKYEAINIRGKKKPVTTYLVEDIIGVSKKEMDAKIDTIIQQVKQQAG